MAKKPIVVKKVKDELEATRERARQLLDENGAFVAVLWSTSTTDAGDKSATTTFYVFPANPMFYRVLADGPFLLTSNPRWKTKEIRLRHLEHGWLQNSSAHNIGRICMKYMKAHIAPPGHRSSC